MTLLANKTIPQYDFLALERMVNQCSIEHAECVGCKLLRACHANWDTASGAVPEMMEMYIRAFICIRSAMEGSMILSCVPTRVSLLGGGTDFEDYYKQSPGAVLTTAIDKYIYVLIKRRFDDKIVLNYRERETVEDKNDINHDLIRECMCTTGVENGIEITTLADIPSEGTGLGSSSSVTVGLLQALFAYQNQTKTQRELANLACDIEIKHLQKPIGVQDQYIAAFGGLRFIEFTPTGIIVESISIPDKLKRQLNNNLLMFYTGITRKAEEVLTDQKANIPQRFDVLRAMAHLAHDGKGTLMNGDIDGVGKLLHVNWELKKQLSGRISNPTIDDLYNTALKAGALGGKVLGAGAGGFLLVYATNGKQDSVRSALHGLRELPFRFSPIGANIIYRQVDDGN